MEDIMITKIVKELHDAQAGKVSLSVQLDFVTKMCDKMAEEMAELTKSSKKEIIEEYTYKVYDELKNKKH